MMDKPTTSGKEEDMISATQAAYGALWWFQSSTPSLHAARRHLLTIIGGKGSDEQRAAIAWASESFGEPLNLDPHESRITYAEGPGAKKAETASSGPETDTPAKFDAWWEHD